MMPSNDSLNAFQYGLYGELQQSRLHTTYRGFSHYKYYRALSYVSLYRCSSLYLEFFIVCNPKIHYR